MTRKNKPVAECTRCGAHTEDSSLINNSCHLVYKKSGKCKGVYRSMLSVDDWAECNECNAAGEINNKSCLACNGSGWLVVRKSGQ